MNAIYKILVLVLYPVSLFVQWLQWIGRVELDIDGTREDAEEETYLDNDRYPTDAALYKISTWKISGQDDLFPLLDFVRELWAWNKTHFTKKDNGIYILITGGDSGNEDLIRAMQKNDIFWCFMWHSSTRGGYHVFAPLNVEVEDDVEPGLYKQWLEKFNHLFDEIPEPSTQEEIKEYLLEAGYNIDELKADGEAFIKKITEKDGTK